MLYFLRTHSKKTLEFLQSLNVRRDKWRVIANEYWVFFLGDKKCSKIVVIVAQP